MCHPFFNQLASILYRWHRISADDIPSSCMDDILSPRHPSISCLLFGWPLCPKQSPFLSGWHLSLGIFSNLTPPPFLTDKSQHVESAESRRVWHGILEHRARICKRLWSPGIDSEEVISPAYVAWRAGTTNRVIVPSREAGNRFLGSLKGPQIRAQDWRRHDN